MILELDPIKEQSWMYDEVEDVILRLFKEEIYFPLIGELEDKVVLNFGREALLDAIRTGRISFNQGLFTGQFSASISRALYSLGSERSIKQGGFRIRLDKLPYDVRMAISASEAKMKITLASIQKKLDSFYPSKISDQLKIDELFDTTLWSVGEKIKSQLKGIVVAPELTKEQRRDFSAAYSKNLQLYIQDWTEKEILTLRKTVELHALEGGRRDTLAKIIEQSYGSSKSKAKFLAKQETSLMLSHFKATQYKSSGIDEYKWKCVTGTPLHPVRPLHKILDGRIFRFDNPPVTDKYGNKNNPGCDYGCRCFAKPIVRF